MKLATGEIVSGLTYHAVEGNPEFIGDASLAEMAQQISKAVGPSGPNREYLLNLELSLKQYGTLDEHVFALADALRGLEIR